MFTGIVVDVGEVVGREATDEGVRLELAAGSSAPVESAAGEPAEAGESAAGAEEPAAADESGEASESAADEPAAAGEPAVAGEPAADESGEASESAESGESALSDLSPGASICVSGACLTVEDRLRADGDGSVDDGRDRVSVFLASETRERTHLGDLGVGDRVNLEPGLPADGRLDGHVVQGHVDATTTVEAIEEVGDDWEFTFALPEELAQYVVDKGFVALDGISLTVAGLDEAAGTFSVAIVPETYRRTTLSGKEPGDPVNVEVDVLAKYVERMLERGGYAADG